MKNSLPYRSSRSSAPAVTAAPLATAADSSTKNSHSTASSNSPHSPRAPPLLASTHSCSTTSDASDVRPPRPPSLSPASTPARRPSAPSSSQTYSNDNHLHARSTAPTAPRRERKIHHHRRTGLDACTRAPDPSSSPSRTRSRASTTSDGRAPRTHSPVVPRIVLHITIIL